MSTAPKLAESCAFELTIPESEVVRPYVVRVPMTEEQFLRWDHGNRLAEWVDGEAFVYMGSTYRHEHIVQFINFLFGLYVMRLKLGEVLRGPYSMRVIPGSRVREPDLFFISHASAGRLGEHAIEGPADVVVEVISPDSPTRDRRDKLREYERAGVPEYWLIDSRPRRKQASFYVLEDGAYVEDPLDGGVFRSRAVPGFWLRTAWLWDQEADPLVCLDEVLAGGPG